MMPRSCVSQQAALNALAALARKNTAAVFMAWLRAAEAQRPAAEARVGHIVRAGALTSDRWLASPASASSVRASPRAIAAGDSRA